MFTAFKELDPLEFFFSYLSLSPGWVVQIFLPVARLTWIVSFTWQDLQARLLSGPPAETAPQTTNTSGLRLHSTQTDEGRNLRRFFLSKKNFCLK